MTSPPKRAAKGRKHEAEAARILREIVYVSELFCGHWPSGATTDDIAAVLAALPLDAIPPIVKGLDDAHTQALAAAIDWPDERKEYERARKDLYRQAVDAESRAAKAEAKLAVIHSYAKEIHAIHLAMFGDGEIAMPYTYAEGVTRLKERVAKLESELSAEREGRMVEREAPLDEAIRIVGNVRSRYPVLMNNKYADVREALAMACDRLVEARDAKASPPSPPPASALAALQNPGDIAARQAGPMTFHADCTGRPPPEETAGKDGRDG